MTRRRTRRNEAFNRIVLGPPVLVSESALTPGLAGDLFGSRQGAKTPRAGDAPQGLPDSSDAAPDEPLIDSGASPKAQDLRAFAPLRAQSPCSDGGE